MPPVDGGMGGKVMLILVIVLKGEIIWYSNYLVVYAVLYCSVFDLSFFLGLIDEWEVRFMEQSVGQLR